MPRWFAVAIVMAALATIVVRPDAAERKGRPVDLVWTRPGFDSLGIASIAMFPVVTFDNNALTERTVSTAWGQAFHTAGYRWVTGSTVRDRLRETPAGDSSLSAQRKAILASARLDSLAAPALCAMFRTDGVLSVRVDRWDQNQLEWNQAGKPSTTIQIRAALLDANGRLVWSGSGSETGEGPYHDPNTNPIGVTSGSLGTQPITGQGGPPDYSDVLARMLTRWAGQFPGHAIAARDSSAR